MEFVFKLTETLSLLRLSIHNWFDLYFIILYSINLVGLNVILFIGTLIIKKIKYNFSLDCSNVLIFFVCISSTFKIIKINN